MRVFLNVDLASGFRISGNRGIQWWGGNLQEYKVTLPASMMLPQAPCGHVSEARALATNSTANKTLPLTECILQEKCTSLGKLAACQRILLVWQAESDRPLLMEEWGW